ncbi:SIMPL domain-containing protein [Stappia sp. BW2]|uniref:SIMPL domain-containing protein n=1 Tax=Stappia sp. BW2 TaxID=2592622 RepID=UPI0011DE7BC4|nr:SIMPL domain-containing protein [Stappia sp. BW2]TYC64739.1 SIMPL domain-containing protein [Stappia sp. BW2]
MTAPLFAPVSLLRKAVLAAGLSAALVSAAPAFAEDVPAPVGTITMQGRGEVSVAPDMAVITASVLTTGKSTADVLAENSAAIAKVIEALKANGIEAKDIQTRGFGIYPRYDHSKSSSSSQPDIAGYEVRNGVEVKIRDLAKLGGVLTLVVESGANSVDSTRFEVSNADEILDEARKKAVEDARHKADVFAAAAGVELGAIADITENGTEMPRPYMMRAEGMMLSKSADVPIEAGEETISATVTIRWTLK